MQYLSIAGLFVAVENWRLEDTFSAFECEKPRRIDLCLRIAPMGEAEPLPPAAERPPVILGRRISVSGDRIDIEHVYEGAILLRSALLGHYSEAVLYFDPERLSNPEDRSVIFAQIYHEFKWIFIGYLARHSGVLLHSASIVYGGRAVAFSAASGTGKSTQARLWQERYGVKMLDGDVNACVLRDGRYFLYGLPWCGTSGICANEGAPLRAVVFLEQGPENRIRRLSRQEAFLRMSARCFLPQWDPALAGGACLKVIEGVVTGTECFLLECLPNEEAVELLRTCLEEKGTKQ